MSIGYQPMPTESANGAATGPAWNCVETSGSTIVFRATMRRDSRM